MECFQTEAEVKAILLATAQAHDSAPDVITQQRKGGKSKGTRDVTFVIRAGAENEALINALTALTITYNQKLWFEGSEINLQSGQNDVDYIYVTATIKPNLGA